MSDLSKTVELLRKAASELESKLANENRTEIIPPLVPSSSIVTTTAPTVASLNSVAEVRRIFAPYASTGNFSSRKSKINTKWAPKWSHKFMCLSEPSQDSVPTKKEKANLLKGGLGEKRLNLDKSDDPHHLVNSVLTAYPKLGNGGGFELLRTANRYCLEVIPPPKCGYTAIYLADQCSIGQSVVYIRPIQKQLDLSPEDNEPSEKCPLEVCLICGESYPVIKLKDHIARDHGEDDLPIINKRKRSTLCQYINSPSEELPANDETDLDSLPDLHTSPESPHNILQESNYVNAGTPTVSFRSAPSIHLNEMENRREICIKCSRTFIDVCLPCQQDEEYEHSLQIDRQKINNKSTKTDDNALASVVESENFEQEMDKIKENTSKDKHWKVSVVRGQFIETAMDQLTEGSESDWLKPLKVNFIGEDGVDHGGLTREFFTLLFSKSPVFEGDSLSLRPDLIEEEHYKIVGKAVGLSILNGHTGPKSLNRIATEFILSGKIPQFRELDAGEIDRADASAIISDIENSTVENIHDVYQTHIDALNQTGFSKIMTIDNKQEAISAVKGYYMLFRVMAPLLQFTEGLQHLNILTVLKKYPDEGRRVLSRTMFESCEDIERLFLPSFSEETAKKQIEEIIIYNFGKFLKRVQNGKVCTPWVDLITEQEEDVVLNTGHILQALLGSPFIPRNFPSGLIIFDHNSNEITHVNTCAPSITFSNLNSLRNYKNFTEMMINVIVCAYGFGTC